VKFKNFLLLSTLFVAACSTVPAGNVGVKVDLYGSDKGVNTTVLTPGRYWIGWNQQLFVFPTFTQTYTWTKNPNEGDKNDESFTFQTVEGLEVNADVGISYHIQEDKVSLVFQKYRHGVDEITNIYLHNMVRDALVTAASTRPIESVYGAGKADLIKAALTDVQSKVSPIGIVIENLNWVGSLRLPENVVQSINNKIQATQQAQQRENEVATAKAEADKAVAEARGIADSALIRAQAEAKANLLLAQSITPTLVQWEALKKWNGALPYVNGGGAVPFVSIGSGANPPIK